jgi:hypothetical protein
VLGCKGLTDLGGKPQLPAGVQDPASLRTPDGALAMYRATVAEFQGALPYVVGISGLFTDELQDSLYGPGAKLPFSGTVTGVDIRTFPSNGDQSDASYGYLHSIRRDAVQAIGALAKYDSARHPALMGEVYSMAGYAEVLLADLYCSGVPLSTIEFEGNYTYRPGSSTHDVYVHATTLFDSTLALAGDSARIMHFARVGKGRALLNIGDYAGAAAAVATVPDTFRYEFPVLWATTAVISNGSKNPADIVTRSSVSDREGLTGLPYHSSGDPRTQTDSVGVNQRFQPIYFPAKYGTPNTTAPLVVASGIEARLIEAEAAYHGVAVPGGSTIAILNRLRQTLYPGVFPPLPTSLSGSALLDTLFTERAAWLFLTGARQGDLRRLIRQYGRNQASVYPTGIYFGRVGDTYGSDVTFPVPLGEQANPLFTGCFNRGA